MTESLIRSELEARINVLEDWNGTWRRPDICLVYVLEGNLTLTGGAGAADRSDDSTVLLKKDDYYVINSTVPYTIRSSEGTSVLQILFSYHSVCRQLGRRSVSFACSSVSESGTRKAALDFIIRNVIIRYTETGGSREMHLAGELHNLLTYLTEHYVVMPDNAESVKNRKDDAARTAAVMDYIHSGLDGDISLSEAARSIYLSESALSRLFARSTGESFNHYVRRVRIERAAELLRDTDISVTSVALECGYSSPPVMNREFQAYYHCTPSAYRAASRTEHGHEDPAGDRNRILLAQRFLQNGRAPSAVSGQSSSISTIYADMRLGRVWKRWRPDLINAGNISLLTNANMQRQILEIQAELGMEYIRVNGLLENSFIRFNQENGRFGFDQLDQVCDFIIEHRLKLFISLGNPAARIMINTGHSVSREAMQAVIFADKAGWLGYLDALLTHLLSRYGADAVREWVLEFQGARENGMLAGGNRPYYEKDFDSDDAYCSVYTLVRRKVPGMRIAAMDFPLDGPDKIRAAIEPLLNSGYAPDILTFVLTMWQWEEKEKRFREDTNEERLVEAAKLVRRIADDCGFKGSLCATILNRSFSSRSYLHDSCFRAAWMVGHLLENSGIVEDIGIWMASDLADSHMDTQPILNGSVGIMTKDRIRKPLFWALKFMTELGNVRMAEGKGYIITGTETGEYRILLFNQAIVSPVYYSREENSFAPDEIGSLFLPESGKEIMLTLDHIGRAADGSGEYTVRQRIVNEENGSILEKWIRIGMPEELSIDDLEHLRHASEPHLEITRQHRNEGRIQLFMHLEPNEVRFIEITPAG